MSIWRERVFFTRCPDLEQLLSLSFTQTITKGGFCSTQYLTPRHPFPYLQHSASIVCFIRTWIHTDNV